MVPDGWREVTLGEFMSFKNGVNASKDAYGSGTKFVNVMDVFGTDRLSEKQIIGEMAVTNKQLKDYSVVHGDVLFNRTSETQDEIALTTVYLDNKPVVFGGFVIRGRQTKKWLLPEFAVYAFQSESIRREMIRRGQGAVRANIGQKDLVKVSMFIPPKAEQLKISRTMANMDQAIDITEKLIVNSERQKKALMQQLLTGKKRLKGFSDDWKVVRLGNVASTGSGGTPKSSVKSYYGGGIPWVSISDMTASNKILCSTERTLTQEGVDNSSAKIFYSGTVLLAMYASIGACNIAGVPLTTSQAILGISCGDNLSNEYLYYYLTSQREKFKLQGQQGTQSNLNAGMVKAFWIPLPSKVEQEKIAEVLSHCDEEIQNLVNKRRAFEQERTALMQQLLTGKRRVKIDEEIAA